MPGRAPKTARRRHHGRSGCGRETPQTQRVFVRRLVVEGSVEQTMLAMQERKQGLADAIFDPGAGGPLALDEADIGALFRPLGL